MILAKPSQVKPIVPAPAEPSMTAFPKIFRLRQTFEATEGSPIHFDRVAFEADHVVVCNRVKGHTGFDAPHQVFLPLAAELLD